VIIGDIKKWYHNSMTRPKILIALFRLPYPATDGTRYKILYNLAEGLKQQYDIEFFVVNIKKYNAADVEYLEKHFGKVHLFHHSKIAYGLNAIPAFLNGLPLQAQAFHFSDAQQWLDAHINDYAAVYVHEIRMTEFFINYSDAQKQKFIVDFNDAISMNYKAGVQKMNFVKRLFYSWEGKRVSYYETKVLKSFRHFSIVSHVDKKYLLEQAGMLNTEVDFSVINHGAPMTETAALLDADKLFFLGSLDYEPNRDALEFFLENVWGEVSRVMPYVELLVIGGGRIKDSWKFKKNVSFLGFVPSVFEAVTHCKALIAPIRFAGGTPSKIIEAMGYGIPVLTTVNGAQGISGTQNLENIITLSESDSQAWVDAIQKIMSDDQYRKKIGINGRALVTQSFSQESAQTAFLNRFELIINK
jgi:glycosyltransferase involved in cell wall biosynthesis